MKDKLCNPVSITIMLIVSSVFYKPYIVCKKQFMHFAEERMHLYANSDLEFEEFVTTSYVIFYTTLVRKAI